MKIRGAGRVGGKQLADAVRELLVEPEPDETSTTEKPPIGLRPLWTSFVAAVDPLERVEEIRAAIGRYGEAGKHVPGDWHAEIALLERLARAEAPVAEPKRQPNQRGRAIAEAVLCRIAVEAGERPDSAIGFLRAMQQGRRSAENGMAAFGIDELIEGTVARLAEPKPHTIPVHGPDDHPPVESTLDDGHGPYTTSREVMCRRGGSWLTMRYVTADSERPASWTADGDYESAPDWWIDPEDGASTAPAPLFCQDDSAGEAMRAAEQPSDAAVIARIVEATRIEAIGEGFDDEQRHQRMGFAAGIAQDVLAMLAGKATHAPVLRFRRDASASDPMLAIVAAELKRQAQRFGMARTEILDLDTARTTVDFDVTALVAAIRAQAGREQTE